MTEELQSLTTKSCLQAKNVSALICELTDVNVCVLQQLRGDGWSECFWSSSVAISHRT